jgi:peptidoglycan/xylan/chitin deacetylase (PgdA/CDA1 family)
MPASRRFPILSYHAIIAEDQKELPPPWSPYHALSLAALRAQLDVLAAEGWQAIPPQLLMQFAPPGKSVVITFDDGESSDLLAAEELSRRGLTAAFFVTWSRLGCPWFLSRSQVVQLDRQGFTIGSHGMTHARLTELSAQELHDQLVNSRERLEWLLGKPVTTLAIPYGFYNSAVVEAAITAGYRLIMTSDFALAVAGRCLLPRLTISSRTTLNDFRTMLAENWIAIARRRLVNGIHRRLNRMRLIAAGGH